jgi:hypothetical protein
MVGEIVGASVGGSNIIKLGVSVGAIVGFSVGIAPAKWKTDRNSTKIRKSNVSKVISLI